MKKRKNILANTNKRQNRKYQPTNISVYWYLSVLTQGENNHLAVRAQSVPFALSMWVRVGHLFNMYLLSKQSACNHHITSWTDSTKQFNMTPKF